MRMHLNSSKMKALLTMAVLMYALAGAAISLRAQTPVLPPTPAYQPLTDGQLDQLLGPIALYPDPLIAQILPASTFPTEIVLADRYVSGGGDPNQVDQQPWDSSVRALAHYPDVLKWMDANLEWTTDLGQAFLNQPEDVMNSIQRLRTSAYNLGNLRSAPQQQVINDGGYIEIIPVNSQVIYVPVYQPSVVYYQVVSGPPVIVFNISYVIGWWLNCDFDWVHHHIVVWHRDHPRPPNWWREPPRQRSLTHTTVWHPRNPPARSGAYRGDRGWGTSRNQLLKQPVVAPKDRPMPEMPPKTPTPKTRPESPTKQSVKPRGQTGTPVTQPQRPVARPERPAARPPAITPANNVRPIPPANYNRTRPESNGAFIGVRSSRDARTYSNRGRESTQTVTHSAPAQHSVPAPRPARSSGGGNNRDSSKRH